MSAIDLPEREVLLATGFAQRLRSWAQTQAAQLGRTLDRDALRNLYRAAWQTSRATSAGHVCLNLRQLIEQEPDAGLDLPGWRELLLDSGVVGTPAAPQACPLLLDAGDRLYLHKYFALEQALAQRLLQANAVIEQPRADTIALLNRLFDSRPSFADSADLVSDSVSDPILNLESDPKAAKPDWQKLAADLVSDPKLDLVSDSVSDPKLNLESDPKPAKPDWQKLAAALALLRRVCIISGGPGTGKTTTVANILACLLHQDPACRIALAAPTGKAAARMLDALKARSANIPPELAARFPQEAHTVHRLLGVTPAPGVFRHNAKRPLACDVLVVDEASMLDLALAARLFDALPASARVILLGDQDQLAAVEAGAVFSELSANPGLSPQTLQSLAAITGIDAGQIRPARAPRGPGLPDSSVWLSRNYRFGSDSAIGRLAALVVGGDAAAMLQWLGQGPHAGVDWLGGAAADGQSGTQADLLTGLQTDLQATSQTDLLERAVREYAGYVRAVQQHEADPALVFAAFERFRVLCALRNGARGVTALNQALETRLKALLPSALAPSPWYCGRAVIVTRNDYGLRLFNGDVGIALRDGEGRLRVLFADRELGYREVAIHRLPTHEAAFAMTVHRAQGSEFESVMVVMPEVQTRVSTRELLYTALTRARERLVLCGTATVLAAAVSAGTERASGLGDRLLSR